MEIFVRFPLCGGVKQEVLVFSSVRHILRITQDMR